MSKCERCRKELKIDKSLITISENETERINALLSSLDKECVMSEESRSGKIESSEKDTKNAATSSKKEREIKRRIARKLDSGYNEIREKFLNEIEEMDKKMLYIQEFDEINEKERYIMKKSKDISKLCKDASKDFLRQDGSNEINKISDKYGLKGLGLGNELEGQGLSSNFGKKASISHEEESKQNNQRVKSTTDGEGDVNDESQDIRDSFIVLSKSSTDFAETGSDKEQSKKYKIIDTEKMGIEKDVTKVNEANNGSANTSKKVVTLQQSSTNGGTLENRQSGRRCIYDDSSQLHSQDSLGDANKVGDQSHERIGRALENSFKKFNKLCELVKGKSELPHPLCIDCSEELMILMERLVSDSIEEYSEYAELLLEMEKNDIMSGVDEDEQVESMEKEYNELKKQHANLQKESESLDSHLNKLMGKIDELEYENTVILAREKLALDKEKNEFETRLEQLNEELLATVDNYEKARTKLNELQQTNVYNDLFSIKFELGSNHVVVGTINGFRLGRVSVPMNIARSNTLNSPLSNSGGFGTSDDGNPNRSISVNNGVVSWNEINAAWGQLLLLLVTVAKKLNYEFKDYILIPMGSYSQIKRVSDDKQILELYGSGDLHLGRLFQNRRFDMAMVAFLGCLKELCKFVEVHNNPGLRSISPASTATNSGVNPSPKGYRTSFSSSLTENQTRAVRMPYKINGDLIGNVSIKMQFSNDETWTKALVYTLVNCKWLLAFASKFSIPDSFNYMF
ncbi:Beclin-1-like protein B [Zancudomyces culisetae]|uniref:Beclin-1-like protein B n=1 Tax=Zancudomyces culisetae TaxID=1213189 RepID=A0A1R1PWK5_ZANCU|nr:Beclin-1-like protein B [Zancudomyces culisetae]|eukprot:OMH85351.1 Beclin-1-like protein B [Zancudomyces culisetae]